VGDLLLGEMGGEEVWLEVLVEEAVHLRGHRGPGEEEKRNGDPSKSLIQ